MILFDEDMQASPALSRIESIEPLFNDLEGVEKNTITSLKSAAQREAEAAAAEKGQQMNTNSLEEMDILPLFYEEGVVGTSLNFTSQKQEEEEAELGISKLFLDVSDEEEIDISPLFFDIFDDITLTSLKPPILCCMCEEKLPRDTAPIIVDTKTESFKKSQCEHYSCKNCMEQWVESQLEQRSFVLCPHVDCSNRIYVEDIMRLSLDVSQKYLSKMTQDFKSHTQEIMTMAKENEELRTFLNAYTIACPQCKVIIERSVGCNVMQCVCGQTFCFDCKVILSQCVCDDGFGLFG